MPQSIILASGSSIRADMLTQAGIAFEVMKPRVDEESVKVGMLAEQAKPRDIADTLAEIKARTFAASGLSDRPRSSAGVTQTKIPLAGVIGAPVAHSKSPQLQHHWLKALGLKGHYIPMHVESEDLEQVLRTLPQMGLWG